MQVLSCFCNRISCMSSMVIIDNHIMVYDFNVDTTKKIEIEIPAQFAERFQNLLKEIQTFQES